MVPGTPVGSKPFVSHQFWARRATQAIHGIEDLQVPWRLLRC